MWTNCVGKLFQFLRHVHNVDYTRALTMWRGARATNPSEPNERSATENLHPGRPPVREVRWDGNLHYQLLSLPQPFTYYIVAYYLERETGERTHDFDKFTKCATLMGLRSSYIILYCLFYTHTQRNATLSSKICTFVRMMVLCRRTNRHIHCTHFCFILFLFFACVLCSFPIT